MWYLNDNGEAALELTNLSNPVQSKTIAARDRQRQGCSRGDASGEVALETGARGEAAPVSASGDGG